MHPIPLSPTNKEQTRSSIIHHRSSNHASPTPSSSGLSRRSPRNAFSLVELSIVLVILGLLTGGILAGQSLIRAAELRAVSAEIPRYQAAIHTFRDKYMAIPGDMRNAVRFWGAQAGGTADGTDTACTTLTTAATGTATCNGNGDGRVTDCSFEMHRFWQHLANAGLIEGQYGGVAGPAGGCHSVFGTNAPASRMGNGGYSFSYLNFGGDGGTYTMDFGNLLWFGATYATTNSRAQGGVLLPEEAWNLDTKLDDGSPASGTYIARSNGSYAWGNANACTTSASSTDYTGSYNVTAKIATCAFMIRNQQ